MGNDFRIPVDIKEITDSSGNKYTNLVIYGEEYAVDGWELRRDEPYVSRYDAAPSNRWKVWLDVRAIPKPLPEPTKRTRKLSDLGLRRPK